MNDHISTEVREVLSQIPRPVATARPPQPFIELPPTLLHSSIEPLAAEHAKLLEQFRETRRTLTELEGGRPRADRLDEEALAQAMRSGKKDPGAQHRNKLETEIGETRRRMDGLTAAIRAVEADIARQVEEVRDEWRQALSDEEGAARDEFASIVESLAAARNRWNMAHAVGAWLDRFPSRKPWSVPLRSLERLRSPNGGAYRWKDVIDALRADVVPETQRFPANVPVVGDPPDEA